MAGAFQDIVDQQEASDVELSENVAEDVIEYIRGNIVGHEEQGLLMFFGLLSGWAYREEVHNNTLGIGPPGSGKSLTKETIQQLIQQMDKYTKTDASSNAILDSVEWDLSLVAPLDEYDKIDRNIVEVLKSSNPVDGGYSKDRNVEDPDAAGGYSPTEVSADPNPWVVLYAPSSKKGGVNDELEDRALVLYFSNDKHTRRGIMRKEFGHENIGGDGHDQEYIYDTQALSAALRQHIRDLPVREVYEEDEEGEQQLVSRRGDTLTFMPKWVAYVVEPIFNLDENYANRTFGIVDTLIRSSAIVNHENRPKKDTDVYVDDDSTETETRSAVVVQAQDVANVLCCLPTLLSTTHQLTPIKRHILDAVDATEPMTDGDGTTVKKVRDWLSDNDIPHPSENTLRNKLQELSENYYLHRWEGAAGQSGRADAYERRDEGALQAPRVYDLQRHADRDGVSLTDETITIDTEDPFDGVTDPIRDQPFKETVEEFEAQFSGDTVDDDDSTEASSFMGSTSDSTDESDTTNDSGGQATFDGVSEDGVETTETIELDPDGEPDDPTEQWVYEHLQQADGVVYGPSADVTQYTGITSETEHSASTDLSGTAVDPAHELWQNRPDHADDRVINEGDALQELSDAYGRLRNKGIVVEDEDDAPPKMMKIRVAEC